MPTGIGRRRVRRQKVDELLHARYTEVVDADLSKWKIPAITPPAEFFPPHFPPITQSHPHHRNLSPQTQIGAPMSSQRKINSARANGAKSRGPKTEAGRKASSMNAVTHGLYTNGVVLANESREEYQEMLDGYLRQFQPDGPVEFHLVEEMVAAKWRQRRLWAIEADLLEDEMIQQKAKLDAEDPGYSPITPLSFAYAALAAATALPFLNRNESRLERTYARALKTLLELQHLRKTTPKQNIQERTESQIRTPQLFPAPATYHDQPQRETRNEKRETEALDVTRPNSLA